MKRGTIDLDWIPILLIACIFFSIPARAIGPAKPPGPGDTSGLISFQDINPLYQRSGLEILAFDFPALGLTSPKAMLPYLDQRADLIQRLATIYSASLWHLARIELELARHSESASSNPKRQKLEALAQQYRNQLHLILPLVSLGKQYTLDLIRAAAGWNRPTFMRAVKNALDTPSILLGSITALAASASSGPAMLLGLLVPAAAGGMTLAGPATQAIRLSGKYSILLEDIDDLLRSKGVPDSLVQGVILKSGGLQFKKNAVIQILAGNWGLANPEDLGEVEQTLTQWWYELTPPADLFFKARDEYTHSWIKRAGLRWVNGDMIFGSQSTYPGRMEIQISPPKPDQRFIEGIPSQGWTLEIKTKIPHSGHRALETVSDVYLPTAPGETPSDEAWIEALGIQINAAHTQLCAPLFDLRKTHF